MENCLNISPKIRVFGRDLADIAIGPESSDVLVPRGNMLKIGFGRGFSCDMVMSCSEPWYDSFIVKKILVFANTS